MILKYEEKCLPVRMQNGLRATIYTHFGNYGPNALAALVILSRAAGAEPIMAGFGVGMFEPD